MEKYATAPYFLPKNFIFKASLLFLTCNFAGRRHMKQINDSAMTFKDKLLVTFKLVELHPKVLQGTTKLN